MAVQNVVISLFIFIFINITNAQRSPTISYISQTQIKDIGGTVELSCSVQYTQDYSVIWMKVDKGVNGNSLPISTGSSLILHDSRFSLRYDPTSSTYVLQVKDIQETDAGTYACQILISPSNRVSAEVEVQVRRPPFISDNSTRSVVVSEGEAVEMECYAGGFPLPRISWRRENNAILPTGGSIYRGNKLKIKSIRKEDRGTYYCVAENGVGRGTKRNIAVEVEFAPVVTVPRPRLGQALQYDMDLECHVEAYPPPAITWEKDEITLSNNQHYKISHFAVADEFTDTTLRVITIEKRQYGQYVCKAANKLGTSEGRVELFEKVTEGSSRDEYADQYTDEEDRTPFSNDTESIKKMQENAAIAQENAGRAQEKAAIAQEKAAIAQEIAAIAQEKAALAQKKAAVAQENAAIAQEKAALAQEKAAIVQEKASIAVEKAVGALEQFVEDYFARLNATTEIS